MKQIYIICVSYVVLAFSLTIITTKLEREKSKIDAPSIDTSISSTHLDNLHQLHDAKMIKILPLAGSEIKDISPLYKLDALTPSELRTLKGR